MQIRYLISIFCAATLLRYVEGIWPPPHQISLLSDILFSRKCVTSKRYTYTHHTHPYLCLPATADFYFSVFDEHVPGNTYILETRPRVLFVIFPNLYCSTVTVCDNRLYGHFYRFGTISTFGKWKNKLYQIHLLSNIRWHWRSMDVGRRPPQLTSKLWEIG